ncbi:MAG: DUF308 domain-containing protein [Baekduia sp.]
MSDNDAPEPAAAAAATAAEPGLPQVPWWLIVGVGVLGILAGFLALVWPGATLLLVALTFGIFLIISGLEDLFAAVQTKTASGGARIFFGLLGVLAIAAGIILLFRPGTGLLTLAWVLGLWFGISGIVQLAQGFTASDGRVFNLIFGLIGLVAGVIILVHPTVGIVTLIWIVSISFMLRGLVMIAVGLTVKKANAAAPASV